MRYIRFTRSERIVPQISHPLFAYHREKAAGVKRGKGGVWSNEYFIRNEPMKVKRMQRVRIKGDTKKQSDLATAVGFVNPFLMPTTSPSMVQSSDGQLTTAADAINNGLTNYTFVAPPLVPGTTIPLDQSAPLLLPPKKKQKTTTKSKSTKKKKSARKGSKKKDKSLTPNEVPSSPSKMVVEVPTLPPIYDNSMKAQKEKESTTAEQEAEEDDAMIDTIVRSAISNNMSLLPPSMATEVLPLASTVESSTASMGKPTVQEGSSADDDKATILPSQIPPQPTKRKQRPKCSTPGCISLAVYDNLCLKHGTSKANGVQTEAPVKSAAERALEAATAKLIEEQKKQLAQQAEQTAATEETTKKKASKKMKDGGKNNSEEMDVAHVLFGLASSKASSPVESEQSE